MECAGKSPAWGVGMQYYGTKGCAEARYDAPVRISGEEKWEYPGIQAEPAGPPGAKPPLAARK